MIERLPVLHGPAAANHRGFHKGICFPSWKQRRGYPAIALRQDKPECLFEMPRNQTPWNQTPQNQNVVSWTARIAAYSKSGLYEHALSLFCLVDIPPNKVTFTTALHACAQMPSLPHGKLIHARSLACCLHADPAVCTALVKMYGKCKLPGASAKLLERMSHPDAVAWTALLNAHADNRQVDQARSVFDRMPYRDTFSWNAMIVAYACNHSLLDARGLFDSMPRRDVVSWTAIISAYSQTGLPDPALHLLRDMLAQGFEPNRITFITILDSCSSPSHLEHGKQIHSIISRSGFESDILVRTALLNMYGKCASPDDARILFDKYPHQNVISWTTMMTAYAQNGLNAAAIELFRSMDSKPNEVTFAAVLDACANATDLKQGKIIHAQINRNGFESDIFLENALINMYGKCGCLQSAISIFARMRVKNVVSWTAMLSAYASSGGLEDSRALFEKMPHRDAVSWSAIITAYIQNGQWKGALHLFQRMLVSGDKPSIITLTSVLDACASLAALNHGKMVHAAFTSSLSHPDLILENALVNMYGKCGSSKDARSVFDKISQPGVVSWTSMIAAYALNGQGKKAVETFKKMELGCIKPDKFTFMSVLSACSRTGLLDDGRECFVSMYKDHSIMPMAEHCVSVIDLLGRSGLLDETEDIITSLPFEPPFAAHAVAWMGFLSSCRVYGDTERGPYAAEHLSQFDLNLNDYEESMLQLASGVMWQR